MSTFHYRFIKTTWGIAVEIFADIRLSCQEEHYATSSNYSIGLLTLKPPLRSIEPAASLKKWLTEEEINYLNRGMDLVSAQIPVSLGVIVEVQDLIFNETDYQPEGLALAVAGLLTQELNLPGVHVPIQFSKEKKRYIFDFDHVESLASRN
ncbi:hypothetical protein [Gloeobacter violaceus]|uniref:hypothetical protein n=1 Tax=Gloeobacter violaceus TaxID=33072 RepID=UPI0013E8BEAC|nr:hypothetical protein [Gloeobacter violaceus]